MAFAGGPVSFQRFFITGDIGDAVTDQTIKALQANAFGRHAVRPDDTQQGWVGTRHLFDTDLDAEHVAYGPYLHIALRVDRLRAPANLVRAYIQMEEQAVRDQRGRGFLSKSEKRKARETALLRAEQEAKAGSFRRMSAYPMLIDPASRTVLVSSTSVSVADRAGQLFSDTFGVTLEAATPERVAQRLLTATREQRALEGLTTFHLVRAPVTDGDGRFAGPDLSFLGKEFLTWLWHHTDRDDGPLRVRSDDDVTVMLEKTLRLRCDFGQSGVTTISADGPARLPEARAALRAGKQPIRAGLVMSASPGELRLTLDGQRLTVSSLVLPENTVEHDWRAQQERRFELIFETATLIEALFELFLRTRIARDWDRTLREMSAWARGDSPERALRAASA